jgi:hypothetical protein
MVTAGGKVVFGKYAQVTNNPENDGCINAVLRKSPPLPLCLGMLSMADQVLPSYSGLKLSLSSLCALLLSSYMSGGGFVMHLYPYCRHVINSLSLFYCLGLLRCEFECHIVHTWFNCFEETATLHTLFLLPSTYPSPRAWHRRPRPPCQLPLPLPLPAPA